MNPRRQRNSIRVSDKHGVNPALGVCFWCRKENGTVVLVGLLPDDAAAPRHVWIDYEPCDHCKTQFARGVLLIEASHEPMFPTQPPIGGNAYPTGNFAVITDDAVDRLFDVTPAKVAREHRRVFVSVGMLDRLLPPSERN